VRESQNFLPLRGKDSPSREGEIQSYERPPIGLFLICRFSLSWSSPPSLSIVRCGFVGMVASLVSPHCLLPFDRTSSLSSDFPFRAVPPSVSSAPFLSPYVKTPLLTNIRAARPPPPDAFNTVRASFSASLGQGDLFKTPPGASYHRFSKRRHLAAAIPARPQPILAGFPRRFHKNRDFPLNPDRIPQMSRLSPPHGKALPSLIVTDVCIPSPPLKYFAWRVFPFSRSCD